MAKFLITGADGQLGQCFQLVAQEFSSNDFIFANQNELDISLCSGIRKTQDNMYPVEKYIRVDFGIISGDVWFKKLRRK